MNKRSLLILGFSIITLAANQLSVLAQTRQPTSVELKKLRQEFKQVISSNKKNQQNAIFMEDKRTQDEKQTRQSLVQAWSKVEPGLAPFTLYGTDMKISGIFTLQILKVAFVLFQLSRVMVILLLVFYPMEL